MKLHGVGPKAVGEIRRALVEKDFRDINGWNEGLRSMLGLLASW